MRKHQIHQIERHTHESSFSTRHHDRRSLRLAARLGLAVALSAGISAAALAAPAEHSSAAAPASVAQGVAMSGNRLIIPSIGFNKVVTEGWTREINQGKIVKVGECWPDDPKTAGLPCSTTWIAGHHTTHGSPFRNLPNVKVGATVKIVHDGTTFTYKITSKISAARANPPKWVFTKDLMLQCSNGSKAAWVLSGDLVSVKPA